MSLQIRAAAGEKIELPDTRPWSFRGHAIECRINAEDPKTFAPWPGLITEYFPPGGTGVRVDSGVYGGWTVPQHYDSLIAKLIVHAPTRDEAIIRMRRALDEFIVGGIRTNIELHKRLLDDDEVIAGEMTTRTIERGGATGLDRRALWSAAGLLCWRVQDLARWAHNSHLGDALASSMMLRAAGEITAAIQYFRVDADIAESSLMMRGEAAALGIFQEVANEGRLPSAEKAGDDRCRNFER